MTMMMVPMAHLKIKALFSQSGTALVEFVVVMTVMIPLLFGIPMIGKIIDLKQTTVQASRYSAWETTVSPIGRDVNTSSQQMDERFFSDGAAPIGGAEIGPNTLWGPAVASGDGSNQTQPLTGYQADTAIVVSAGSNSAISSGYDAGVSNGVQYAPGAGKGVAHTVGKFVDVIDTTDELFGGDWSMDTDGLVRGEASVQMEGNGWLGPQTITQSTVIMADNWSVGDATQARDRVRSLVPAGILKPAGQAIGFLGNVPLLKELKYYGEDSGRGVFGHVDMEPLPASENDAPRPLKEYEE